MPPSLVPEPEAEVVYPPNFLKTPKYVREWLGRGPDASIVRGLLASPRPAVLECQRVFAEWSAGHSEFSWGQIGRLLPILVVLRDHADKEMRMTLLRATERAPRPDIGECLDVLAWLVPGREGTMDAEIETVADTVRRRGIVAESGVVRAMGRAYARSLNRDVRGHDLDTILQQCESNVNFERKLYLEQLFKMRPAVPSNTRAAEVVDRIHWKPTLRAKPSVQVEKWLEARFGRNEDLYDRAPEICALGQLALPRGGLGMDVACLRIRMPSVARWLIPLEMRVNPTMWSIAAQVTYSCNEFDGPHADAAMMYVWELLLNHRKSVEVIPDAWRRVRRDLEAQAIYLTERAKGADGRPRNAAMGLLDILMEKGR